MVTNFDIKLKIKNNDYEIKNNEFYMNGENSYDNVPPSHINQIIEASIKKIESIPSDYLNQYNTMTETIEEINNLRKATGLLKMLKSQNCSSFGSKVYEELKATAESIFYIRVKKIDYDKFSYPERLVLAGISGHIPYNMEPGLGFFYNLYDPITNDKSKIISLQKEVAKYFEWAKEKFYGNLGYFKDFNVNYKKTLGVIEQYEKFKEYVGEEVVDWSGAKITRRYNTCEVIDKTEVDHYYHSKRYTISRFIDRYAKHLKSKGVSFAKDKKLPKIKRLENQLKDDPSKLTQDDLLTLFKGAPTVDAQSKSLEMLDLNSFRVLIDSKLKCVTSKMDEYATRENFLELIMENDATPENYQLVLDYLEKYPDFYRTLHWDFFYKYIDIVDVVTFVKFVKDTSDPKEPITPELYNKVIDKIPKEYRLSLHEKVSNEFINRMNIDEKEKVLNKLQKLPLTIKDDDLVELFSDVPYERGIKKLIQENTEKGYYFSDRIAENNDKDTAKKLLTMERSRMSGNKKANSLFKLLEYKEKVDILQRVSKKVDPCYDTRYYSDNMLDIFSTEDIKSFLKLILTNKHLSIYLDTLIGQVIEKKLISKNELATIVKDTVLTTKKETYFKLTENTIEAIGHSREVRKRLLEGNFKIQKAYSSSYWYRYISHKNSEDTLTEFFKIFTREDIEETIGLWNDKFRQYFPHVFEIDELISLVHDPKFFRTNYDIYPVSYLKRFKDKKEFKKIVGDRRNRDNRSFAEKLAKKLDISNGLDFLLSDD